LKNIDMEQTFRLVADKAGERLDRYVSDRCPELTRTQTQKLIGEGHITVNSVVVKASHKINAGEWIDINIPPPQPSPLIAEDIPLNIIYEDEDLLVVDKPAGMTVHPAPGHSGHTLVNAILSHYPRLADIGDSLRPGIVHRLDKDTSGVMLVAKNQAARLNLANQFKTRAVTKVYLALVKGRLTPQSGVIEAAIGRDPRNRQRMAVVAGGREARTEYRILEYLHDYTLLELILATGRTHQIRVHLAAIGYPVIGDATYGVKSTFLSRQFLHAKKLGFKLPATGGYVEFTSELPPDLECALKNIK